MKIHLTAGSLQGVESNGVAAFKGIPYAEPIEGIARFTRPKRRQPWKGTHDATAYGHICPQQTATAPAWLLSKPAAAYLSGLSDMGAPQGPDCLNLNVWSSRVDPEAKQPVMVWFHGGGLSLGASSQLGSDGAALARKGVVVVSANYRLGALGFLNGEGLFDEDILIANRGFMDTALVLEWVRDHIGAFGGDPDNVTIFGHSAGGTCVGALLCSPEANGLFHRAIIMSGPVMDRPLADHQTFTRAVLDKLRIEAGDTDALAELSNDKIVGTLLQQMLFKRGRPFGSMSDVKHPAQAAHHSTFLPTPQMQAFAEGAADGIDLLVGTAADDGRVGSVALPGPKTLGMRFFNNGMFAGLFGPDKAARKAKRQAYRRLLPELNKLQIEERMQTDGLYRQDLIRIAEHHSSHAGNTYMYRYDWTSPVHGGALGAIHGLDAVFAFNNVDVEWDALGDRAEAAALADAMSDAWVAFAKTGTPRASGLPDWPEYDQSERQTMLLDRRSSVANAPDDDVRRLWASVRPDLP